MYIITNGQTYQHIRVLSTSSSVRFVGDSLPDLDELDGMILVYADNGFELRIFNASDFLRQEIAAGSWLLTNTQAVTPNSAVPVEYDLLTSVANMTRMLMKGEKPKTADEIIMCSALYDEWKPGKHVAGDIFSVDGDVWECFQNYDNAVNPDIAPGQSGWYTFNRPYHGTSRETAREFIHPTGAHDMYKAGEWAVQDGKFTECLSDTAYSLAEYPAAWKVRE